jgi:hypothetical protein
VSYVTVRETPLGRYAVVYNGVKMGTPYDDRDRARDAARRLARREGAELDVHGQHTARFQLTW